jgi:hypothetical protein
VIAGIQSLFSENFSFLGYLPCTCEAYMTRNMGAYEGLTRVEDN